MTVLGRHATIRARTTAAACLVVAIALVVTAVLFLSVMRRALESNIGNGARARAEELALLMQRTKLPSALPDSGEKGAVVQVVDEFGASLAASAQVIDGSRLSELQPKLGETQTESRSSLPITGDQSGDPFHIIAFGAQTARGPITVYVGVGLDQVHENVASARQILLLVFPTLLAIVGATSWYFVGRALRPVDVMRRQVARIGDEDLSRRIPEPSVDDEIGRLARGMNEMLRRLQDSSDRQLRFVADASHELQSPLASTLADLEEAIAHPAETEWDDLAKSLVEDNQRMTRLVGDLLFLATTDSLAGGEGFRDAFVDVDLDDIIRVEAQRLQTRVGVNIDLASVTPVEVRGNPDQLARVVRNLLENATRHASSWVSAELSTDGTDAVLVVCDDGPGVPPDAWERIFERFTRLDDSRSRGSGGSGLGLAIAREIAESHGGSIVVESSPGGARFVVRLSVSTR